ncbi:unnamed protein product [Microthlaspi erraticum]|uniref:DUF4371 domain-containing protein n=1 Tax=Microthlaspi erraticum TaxID=1685480 RepID=A0A6D2HN61_9BRAS|nr:unnamed protein product [Microthlaspi erraticum]
MFKQDDIVKKEYRIRLTASIDSSRFLLHQGLAFRGHDESEDSINQGNFKQLVKYTGDQNDAIGKVILKNAPKNNQMVSSLIQKDIVNSFGEEVVKSVIEEIDHGVLDCSLMSLLIFLAKNKWLLFFSLLIRVV